MTDQELLSIYVKLVPFIAEVFGPGIEVLVHDVSNPEHSLIAICNNVSGREVGAPLTDLARDIQQKGTYNNISYTTNYTGWNKKGYFLSSTYYIKNEGRLIGLLCINKDTSAVQEFHSSVQLLLEKFNLQGPKDENISENLNPPITNLIQDRISEIISQTGVIPSRMTSREKIKIVHRLNKEGVLMLKGAVTEIATQLNISVPTVYRYLNKPVN